MLACYCLKKNTIKGLGMYPSGRQFSKPKQSLCGPDWLGFLGRNHLAKLETCPPSRQVSDWDYYYCKWMVLQFHIY